MKKLKFVVIGCGRIGGRHLEQISSRGEISAVCDIDNSKATHYAKIYGCKSYTSIDDLINDDLDFDVASICTPNGLHFPQSIALLKAKKHVLCEKPIALSADQVGEMIITAEKNNVRLFAVKQNRFNPPVVKLKELIAENALGNISSIQLNCFWNRNEEYYTNSWKGSLDLDGGTLYTQFSHFIDLLYWFFGDIEDVKGFSKNDNHSYIDFEDTGVVVLKFKNGIIGSINYNVNAYNKNFEGSLAVFGTKGTFKIGGQYLNEIEYQEIEGLNKITVDKGNLPNNYGSYVGSMSNHGLVYDNLIAVLDNDQAISANAFEALKTVEIIERIYKAIR